MEKNELFKKVKKDLSSDDYVRFKHDGLNYYVEHGTISDYNYDIMDDQGSILDGGMFDGSIDEALQFMTSNVDYLKEKK